MTDRRSTHGVELGTGIAALVGVFASGAGVLHLLAARDHLEHTNVAAFFVVLALAQFAWGALVVWLRSPVILQAGIAGNLGVVAIWALSRTTGLPFADAVADVEPVGLADATATMFELMSAAGAALLLALPVQALATRLSQPRGERLIAAAASAALLLVVPSFVTKGHTHHDGDVHVLGTADEHDDTALVSASGHAHETPMDEHPHGSPAAAPHPHDVAAPVMHEHGSPQAAVTPHAHGDDPPSRAASRGNPPPAPKPRGQVATMLYGPFVLPPSGQLGDAVHREAAISNRIMPAIVPPCVNCMVTSMTPDLVYADGTSANLNTGPMLHHTVLFDTMRNDPTCGRGSGAVGFIGHRIFASGNERTPMLMPDGYAIKIDSPWWAGIFEIMNNAPTFNVVFFKMTVTYLPIGDPSVKPVTPIWLDVDNCADSQFTIPKGESNTKWKWKSDRTGRIVGTGGHVHDGGISITLSNATRGERMCTSLAGYGKKPEFMGSVESMSSCWHDRIGVVRAGEYLAIDAYYNSLERKDDVMGIMMAFLYETDDLSGGSPPPAYYTQPPPDDAPPPQGGHHH